MYVTKEKLKYNEKVNRFIGEFLLISIGIDKYLNNASLYNCENDAKSVNDAFVESKYLKMQQNGSYIISSNKVMVTKDIMVIEIADALKNVEDKTNIFFYYSGHGCTKNNEFYFVLSDSTKQLDTMISLSQVEQMLRESNNGKHGSISIVIDACRDIQDTTKGVAGNNKKYVLDYISRSNGIGIMYSCSKGECSQNGLGDSKLSIFTSFLIKALQGEKSALDGEYLTFSSMYKYLEQECYKASRGFLGVSQHPEYRFSGNEIFYGCFNDLKDENTPFELNDILISDLYFGTVDADTEMHENEDKFIENYFDLDKVSQKIWNETAKQFVIGRKGTGKTYIGKYLEKTKPSNIKYFAMDHFDYKSFSFLATKGDGYEKYLLPWKYFIYAELLLYLNSIEPDSLTSSFLKELYGRTTTISQILHKKFKKGVSFKNEELSAELQSWLSKEGTVFELSEITEIFRLLLIDNANTKYLFILDGLDEKINERDDYPQVMNALIWAIKAINDQTVQDGKEIKVTAFFRKDVFEFVAGANTAKISSGSTITLDWVTSSVDKKKYPLYQFMNIRYLNCLEAHNIDCHDHEIMEIFPQSINYGGSSTIDTWSWILNMTTYKPRDVVQMLKECKNKCTNNETTISETVLWEAQTDYSNYLIKEFKNELYGFIDERLIDEIFNVCSEMARRWVSYQEVKALINKCAQKVDMLLSEEDIKTIINRFYEVGVFGMKFSNDHEQWYYRKNIKANERIDSSRYKLHIGLWKTLSIW